MLKTAYSWGLALVALHGCHDAQPRNQNRSQYQHKVIEGPLDNELFDNESLQPDESRRHISPADQSVEYARRRDRTGTVPRDRKRQKRQRNPRRQRSRFDAEKSILAELGPLLSTHPHWMVPKIPTSAAMELGDRISKSIVPVYASLTALDERIVTPQWIGVIGEGLPTPESWTIFVGDVRRHSVEYLQYPSCLGTRFVEASKLSHLLQESFVNARLVEETIVRLLATPPPEGTCMSDIYAQVMLILTRERPRSNEKDWSDLVQGFFELYSVVTVMSSLSSTETAIASTARSQFRNMASTIITDPSKVRVYRGQLRVYVSRYAKQIEDHFAQNNLV